MESYLSPIIVGVFAFFNTIILIYFSRRNQQSQNENAKQLEAMRIEYSCIFNKRREAIEEIYNKLNDFRGYMEKIAWAESEEEFCRNMASFDINSLQNRLKEIVNLYNRHKIYLSASIFDKLEQFTKIFYKQIEDYEDELSMGDEPFNPLENFGINIVDCKWNEHLDEIVADFQKLIIGDYNC